MGVHPLEGFIGLLEELVRLVDQWVIVRLTIGVLVEVYCIVIVTCKMGQS